MQEEDGFGRPRDGGLDRFNALLSVTKIQQSSAEATALLNGLTGSTHQLAT
jgi:hypothetical protein